MIWPAPAQRAINLPLAGAGAKFTLIQSHCEGCCCGNVNAATAAAAAVPVDLAGRPAIKNAGTGRALLLRPLPLLLPLHFKTYACQPSARPARMFRSALFAKRELQICTRWRW